MQRGVRRVAVTISVTIAGMTVATGLTGCGLLHDTPRIDAAAKFLPSDTTAIVFTDRQAVAQRLGVDVSGRDATDEQVVSYNKALADQGWGTTQLATYLTVMKDAPFNELDIRWEAAARWGSGADARSAYVWRVSDKLDLGGLDRSLTEDGWKKDTVDGLARYTIDFAKAADPNTGLVAGMYPAAMTDVLIDSDDHLVVGSGDPAALADIAAVANGDATSLAKQRGAFAPLLDKAEKAEFAAMSTGSGICQQVTAYGTDKPTKPGPLYDALGHPTARALVATGDPMATTSYLEFGSADEAAADATARQALIAQGKELRSEQPFRHLGTFTVTHDGSLEAIASSWATGPRAAVSTEITGGGPAACLPS
ncbi:MAG TPA: hypothetical protein VJ872_12945 [Nocardioides sp.]|nr:hypothetical protein [Nocardioides sp.]